MQKVKKEQLFLFGLFLAILPYLYLCVFSNPSADDFVFAYYFQTRDYFEILKDTFLGWNGRYASNVFAYLNPIGFDSFLGYKIVPLLMILLFLISSFYFVKQLFFNQKSIVKISISLVLGLLFFHNMPIISEGVYWYTGAVIYSLGIIVFQFYIGFLIHVIRNKKRKISYVTLTVLLFLACGFNEVLTLLIVFLLGVVALLFVKNRLAFKELIIGQLVLAIVFSSVLIFAPGNSLRGEAYVEAHHFSSSFLASILQVARFSFLWVASIPLLIASFFYYEINKSLKKELKLFQESFYLNRWISLLSLFTVIFICVFPPYWATGILGQHRTLNVGYAFFLPIWFINLTVWMNYYQDKLQLNVSSKNKLILGFVFLLGVMFTGNGFNALNDVFSGNATQYNIELTRRFKSIQNNSEVNSKAIKLEPLTQKPRCLFVSEISSNPKDWRNEAYNLYFRKDSTEIYLE